MFNIANIHNEIAKKKESNPYFATTHQAVQVLTDYDTFPYPRYFRGIPTSSVPIIAEREAGWRPRRDECYKNQDKPCKSLHPNLCFQAACSTVRPCVLKEKEDLKLIDNGVCNVKYR